MLFNSEKFNHKYKGYELSQRKFERSENSIQKHYSSIKSEFTKLDNKLKGKTLLSFGQSKALSTNEDKRYKVLEKVNTFMSNYGLFKEELSDLIQRVIKAFSVKESLNETKYNDSFKEIEKLLDELKKSVVKDVSGGKKKKRSSKKKSVTKKKSSLKKKKRSTRKH